MKTIKNVKLGKLERVKDREAHNMVGSNGWEYCPKKEWKEITRGDQPSQKKEKEEKETKKEKKKSQEK